MSKKANKTLIGAFVLGAIALVVAGVIVFGSGKFFKKELKFVMFFQGSVKGLQIGSPVVFRGVKIGEVTDIKLEFDTKDLSILIPVYVEVDPGRMTPVGTDQKLPGNYKYIDALIGKGLRAQLQLQSFVTGQLQIGVDFYPDKPILLVGLEKKYHEIPTIPTSMEELQKTIEKIPFKEIAQKLDSTITGLDKFVNSPELHQSTASLNETLKSADALLKNIDSSVKPLVSDLKSTSEAARGTFAQAEKTLAMKEGVPAEIAADVRDTLKSARVALEATQKAVDGVQQIAAQNANLGYDMNRSLEQMTALSRSLRSLTDYLDRHPEAFIRGKHPQKGE